MSVPVKIICLLINLAIVVCEAVGLTASFREIGVKTLQYYTTDSNILAAVAALAMCIGLAVSLVTGRDVSRTLRMCDYFAACTVGLTFIIVLFVLAPMDKEGLAVGLRNSFVTGSIKYVHLICPLLSAASVIACGITKGLPFSVAVLALIPTLLYAAVVIPLNIARVMVGPYGFLHIYEQPPLASVMWFFLIPAIAFGISSGLWKLGALL